MATTYTDATMGARAIGARTDNTGSDVTDLNAEEDRYSQVILTEGWIKPADSFEPVAGSAATMNVIIGSGTAKADFYCVEGNIAGQGMYLVRHDPTTTTVALNAADGSLARKDEIYLVVLDDAYDSTGLALPRLAYRDGTPAASPSVPGPDASWDAYVLLATIDVPAAAADILACTITDERIASTLAIGGITLNDLSDRLLPSGADPLATAAAGTIQPDDGAAVGTANSFARSDHKHAIVTAAAGSIEPDDAAAEGAATSFARSDHKHSIVTAAPTGDLAPDGGNSEGSATSFARSDHKHNVPTASAGNIGTANAEGSSSSFARADHVHRVADMQAVGVKIDTAFDAGGDALTTGAANYHSLSATLPSGWGSAKLVAWGTARYYNDGASTGSMTVRIRIDTTDGDSITAQSEQLRTVALPIPAAEKTITGNATIYVRASYAVSTGHIYDMSITYMMVRVS